MEIFEQPDSRKTFFAELLLPVPISKLFTYRVPFEQNDKIKTGLRAIVQFGDRKVLTGIVINVHETAPKDYEAKYILELLDDEPVVNSRQLRLFHWIAEYYMCSEGEVMNAALPSGLKLSSESMVQLHPAFSWDTTLFQYSQKEEILLKQLQQDTLSYSEISKLLGQKNLYSILKSLVSKEAVILFEEVREKFKPKTEKRIKLTKAYLTHEALEKSFGVLAPKPKQEAVLLKYLQLVPVLQDIEANKTGVSKKNLLEGDISESSVNTLVKNGIFEEFEVIVSRFESEEEVAIPDVTLSEVQRSAQSEILKSFETHATTLLHGITGSGKTEIYIDLIKKALDGGSQVLYLLPEIALTTQIVHRLKKIFGTTMGVYHSKFSDNERVEVWNGVLSGRFKFVVGVRSSIFLPFDNLGLIIVDEEHDTSYKQQEPSPRYHARDVALVMGQMHHAKVLLGSATPSVETFYQAQQDKYGFVQLRSRYGDARLPEVILADMSSERKNKTSKGDFSRMLLKSIGESLSQKEQVIIFQNRRGYSPMVHCEDCGWVPKCINCSVSLTYHQFKHAMICHYCGYREPLPTQCPTCSSKRLITVGYGTEKLEEELKLYFQDATVQRMDFDTTRVKSGYENIIEQFENGSTDILVGTQMVTKGLDFDRVSLVGVFNADRMMHFPDFRSYERAFQLITQVSGRAGRREKAGKVIIQTSHTDHPILNFILNHTQEEFYQTEIADRRQHAYPPFARLVEIVVKHIDKKASRDASQKLADLIKESITDVKILGPGEPIVSKIRNQYLMSILVKIPRDSGHLGEIKNKIANAINTVLKEKEFRSARIVVDVDPV
ncbi:MAG TPA: primosomal protein N' [Cyclobacteriaceae bacterium]|nr:primosomal protein N' [Cyclobacteriaceae bacterium]